MGVSEAVQEPSSNSLPIAAAEADNFMDFSDTTPASGAPVACISRPQLSADRQTVYEDTSRSGHVLAEMHRLYLTGRLCDVVLRVDSERIPCHRLVMAASSVYFERMFSNDMTEARSPEVSLPALPVGFRTCSVRLMVCGLCGHVLNVFALIC